MILTYIFSQAINIFLSPNLKLPRHDSGILHVKVENRVGVLGLHQECGVGMK